MSLKRALSEHLIIGDTIGEDGTQGDPFLLSRDVLNEHAYICGQTGSGKTSVGFIPLLHQLTRPYRRPDRDARGNIVADSNGRPAFIDLAPVWSEHRPPIVILDLKGDPVLFNTARILASQRGYPFRFFSIDEKKASHIFDPFQNLQPRSPIEFCEIILSALSLLHGDAYGESYFAAQHRFALLKALAPTAESRRTIRDWKQLWDLLLPGPKRGDATRALSKDATHLLTVIYALTFYPQMRADGRSSDSRGVIHMPTVIEDRQMVYFWLPAESEMSVREIGKLVLYALHTAAKEHSEVKPPTQTYVFIDEFHLLASEKLDRILTTSRQRGLTFIMANQHSGALRLKTFDLRATVMNSTRFKQFFTVSSLDDLREMLELSGERSRFLETSGSSTLYSPNLFGARFVAGRAESHSRREEMISRLNRDMVRRINADQLSSLVWISRDSGLSQLEGVPHWVRAGWPMSEADYQERRYFHDTMSWPTADETTEAVAPAKLQEAKDDQIDAVAKLLHEKQITELFDALSLEQPAIVVDEKPATGKNKKKGRRPKKTQASEEA